MAKFLLLAGKRPVATTTGMARPQVVVLREQYHVGGIDGGACRWQHPKCERENMTARLFAALSWRRVPGQNCLVIRPKSVSPFGQVGRGAGGKWDVHDIDQTVVALVFNT